MLVFGAGLLLGYFSFIFHSKYKNPTKQETLPEWQTSIYTVPFTAEFNSQANWQVFKVKKWEGQCTLTSSESLVELRVFIPQQIEEIKKLLDGKPCACYFKSKGQKFSFISPLDNEFYIAVFFTNVGQNEFGIKFKK